MRRPFGRLEADRAAVFSPLRVQGSEAFVHEVMRKVRASASQPVGLRWPQFARWAYPALAFSATVFIGGMRFALQPLATPSVDNVLIGESVSAAPGASWFSSEAGEEPLNSSLVNRE